jgi:hypothetical protein
MNCPDCGSGRTRRGGAHVWAVYLAAVAIAIPLVLVLKLNAAIVGGIVLAVVVLVNLILNQRVCLDCGHQWKAGS